MFFIKNTGFSLIELMIVVIIIGVLATLGVGNYERVVEKGRSSEARKILGQISRAQKTYYMEYDMYTNSFANLGTDLPLTCNTSFYFYYWITGGGNNQFVARAGRCSSGGKRPNWPASKTYFLEFNQSGVWSGTLGYI